jgi:hypothetical protein
MKNFNKAPGNSLKQSGFFGLGISLLILVMSGSAVYVAELNHDKKMASLQESTEITMTGEAEIPNEKISKLDSDIPGFAVQ